VKRAASDKKPMKPLPELPPGYFKK
jgi:hypothetical protein